MIKRPKVLPVVVVALLALMMIALSFALPALRLPIPANLPVLPKLLAMVVVNVGVLIFILSAWQFQQYRTTVNPVRAEQVSALLTAGIFRYSRNPMYVAFGLVLLALACWLMHLLAFALLPAYFIYMSRVQIRYEEQMLAAKFGDAFQEYCAQVRRWL